MVEDHFVEDFAEYQGKTLSFKIVELDKEKNRLILSHRAVVEMEKEQREKSHFRKIRNQVK